MEKFLDFLRFLDKKELKKFIEFMKSPFFMSLKSKDAALFNYMLDKSNQFKNLKKIDEIDLMNKLKLTQGNLNSRFSTLNDLTVQFMAHYSLKEEKQFINHLSLKYLLKREDEKSFLSLYNKAWRDLNSTDKKDFEYYYHHFLYTQDYNLFLLHTNDRKEKAYVKKKGNERKLLMPQEAFYSFEQYFWLNRFRLCLEINSMRYLFNLTTEVSYILQIIKEYEKIKELYSYNFDTLLNLYYLCLKIQVSEDDDIFNQLREQLSDEAKNYTKDAIKDLYTVVLNYMIKKQKKGENDAEEILKQIYDEMLDNEILIENGVIKSSHFKNIVSLNLQLGEIPRCKIIINKYIKQLDLDAEQRNIVEAFCGGSVAFYEGKYQEARDELLTIYYTASSIDLFFNMDCRWVLIKTYFMLDDGKFRDEAERYLGFIDSKEIDQNRKKAYYDSGRMLILIDKARKIPSEGSKKKLSEKLEKLDYINNRRWLEELIAQLKK